MKRVPQAAAHGRAEALIERATRMASEILEENRETSFQIVSEEATELADALRLLGCRVHQGYFRTNQLQVTPPRRHDFIDL